MNLKTLKSEDLIDLHETLSELAEHYKEVGRKEERKVILDAISVKDDRLDITDNMVYYYKGYDAAILKLKNFLWNRK